MSFTYVFYNSINKNTAFTDFMTNLYPDIFVSHNSISPTEVEVTFNRELTPEEQISIGNAVSAYVESIYYLVLHHTETQLMNTDYTNSSDFKILQSFIMPPDNEFINENKIDVNTHLGDIKTIIEIATDDVTFTNTWDPVTNPIIISLQIYCLTKELIVTTDDIDITSIVSAWKNADPPLTGEKHAWKTHQIYGLYNVLPNHDCIWQTSLKTNNANIKLKLNGLQKLYYTLD